MKITQVTAAYFSATDTTKKIVCGIAEALAAAWDVPFTVHDFTLPNVRQQIKFFHEGELVVFGVPTYAGRVPNVLLPYLTEGISGSGALAVPVVLYGNRYYDDSLIELRNLLETAEFHTVAGAAFIGEHSFSYKLGAGRPDTTDMTTAMSFASEVKNYVDTLVALPPAVSVNGEDPIRPYYTPRDRHGNPINILKVKPKVNADCTNCGLCARLCPMGSIDPQDVSQYTGICIKCGACVKKCPPHARYYDDEGYLYHKSELEDMYEQRAEPELFVPASAQ